MDAELTGSQVLLVTPFGDDGEIDEESLARHVDFVVEGDVDGIIALGTTGEFFSLSASERAEAMGTIARLVRGRVPLTFGIGDASTRVSIELGRRAAEVGAACVMLQPPFYYPYSPPAIREHFLTVARAVDLPLMVYDGAAGIELSIELLDELTRVAPNIRYAKFSLPKPAKYSAAAQGAPNLRVFCGDDNILLLALRNGAAGCTVGCGNLQPHEVASVCRRYADGEVDGARELHNARIAPAAGICNTKSEFIRCFKEVLAEKGIIRSPYTRPPLLPLEPTYREELLGVMRDIGVL
jgi:4-hydroxy-tetrahydrodipicolinate synthase